MNRIKKLVATVLIFSFLLGLCLPAAQYAFSLVPKKKLEGVGMPRFPKLEGVDLLLNGKYQKKFEQWFKKRNGFWGHLVRLDNQINFDLFELNTSNYDSKLVVGKDLWVFQRDYLHSYNRTNQPGDHHLINKTALVLELQQRLAARGVGLLVLISSNKPAMFPDIVPENLRRKNRLEHKNIYQRMRPMLESSGINFFDAHEFFAGRAAEGVRQDWVASGSHWSDVGACLIARKILEAAVREPGKAPVRFNCEDVEMRPRPSAKDKDVVYMANLWDISMYQRETPYPKVESSIPENVYRPKIHMAGTSFMWSVIRFLSRYKAYRENDFYFYFKTHLPYPEGGKKKLYAETIDWEGDVFKSDLILLEANMASLHGLGSGFVEQAVDQLRVLDGELVGEGPAVP